jgi:hypothetical protein
MAAPKTVHPWLLGIVTAPHGSVAGLYRSKPRAEKLTSRMLISAQARTGKAGENRKYALADTRDNDHVNGECCPLTC